MTDHDQQPEQETDDLIAGRLAAGKNAGKIVISEGFQTVVDGNEGTRADYPAVEPNRLANLCADTSSYISHLAIKKDEELTASEHSFVGTVADLGSRTISYAIENHPDIKLPGDEEFSEASKNYSEAALRFFEITSKAESGESQLDETTMQDLQAFGSERTATTRILNRVTGTMHDLGQNSEGARVLIEDFAEGAITMLDKISAVNPQIDADSYINGNLDHIAAQMQRAQAV